MSGLIRWHLKLFIFVLFIISLAFHYHNFVNFVNFSSGLYQKIICVLPNLNNSKFSPYFCKYFHVLPSFQQKKLKVSIDFCSRLDRRRQGTASGSTIHPALVRDDAGGRDVEVAAKVVPYGQDAFLKQQILKEAQIYKVGRNSCKCNYNSKKNIGNS